MAHASDHPQLSGAAHTHGCAVNEGQTLRKSDIATSCNASENHLGQVIHQLAQMGYIETLRGRCGGLRLARPMDEIGIGEVVRAFEIGNDGLKFLLSRPAEDVVTTAACD